MAEGGQQGVSILQDVSNAMVLLHKEHFGRGPTKARSNFAGPDALLCVLEEVLLPAERKMIELGDADHVRETRVRFQVATTDEFVSAVEKIVGRKIRSFASGIDAENDVAFESFMFESADPT